MLEYEISVIVPIYNAEKTIKKCVDSILEQSMDSVQVILVDDGSVDNSKTIIKEYDSNTNVIIINQKNAGVSAARNRGIEEAAGKYIFFVDSDDYIEFDVLEKMWIFGKKNNLDLIACNHKEYNATIYKGNNGTNKSFLARTPEEIGEHFDDIFPQSAVAKLFKKSLIDEAHIRFPLEMQLGEDMYFTYSYVLKLGSMGKVADVCYRIQNVNPLSLSKRYVDNMEPDIEKQLILWNELVRKYPCLEKTYYKKNLDIKLALTDIYFNNFYKFDCPLSKRERKQKIQEYIIGHEDRVAFGGRGLGKPKNLLHRILKLVLKTQNAWAIEKFYETKEFLKKKKFERGQGHAD